MSRCTRNGLEHFVASHASDSSRANEFYKIIDKLERETPEVTDGKLKELGFTLDAVNAFIHAAEPTEELKAILDNLAARELGDFVKIDYNVIRGLAYYNGPVFEAFDRKGWFSVIGGRGSIDRVV